MSRTRKFWTSPNIGVLASRDDDVLPAVAVEVVGRDVVAPGGIGCERESGEYSGFRAGLDAAGPPADDRAPGIHGHRAVETFDDVSVIRHPPGELGYDPDPYQDTKGKRKLLSHDRCSFRCWSHVFPSSGPQPLLRRPACVLLEIGGKFETVIAGKGRQLESPFREDGGMILGPPFRSRG